MAERRAYIYIGALVMVYAVAAISAILATPESKRIDLEGVAAASPRSR